MKETIRWGIMGCGGIARTFASSVASADRSEIVAAASRTPGRAAEFARKHGIPHHYTDYISMLKSADVDAVYVATTANFHYECVREALEAGKPVLCEKPFTVNAPELEYLVRLAAEKKLFLMEAMWTRFLPAMSQVRKWLADGEIGEVKQLRATFGIQIPFNPDHRLLKPELAGGALLDTGIYPLSFADMVMKDVPVEIHAIADIGDTGVDEQSAYLLRYPSGVIAILDSAISARVISRAEIIGTDGRIRIPDDFLAVQEVILEKNGEEPETVSFPYDEDAPFLFEIDAAADAIRSGLPEHEIMPHSDSLRLMETMDEIRRQTGLVFPNDRSGEQLPL